ncbi:GIY-YIG nuclease family protein [Vibrio ziniensis]|uniref:GIY-YIG nuclease family protein n=1 Tax=Vibrio ziniensis TaxID=2711221 RepID=A0A6G7CPU4_9VIBR|nr:GIY-YIG nuclease family protein [Vibrio ziniensis]QIH44171.1 GIY-YIG nuclease family protein [Vibrio ziniensis]
MTTSGNTEKLWWVYFVRTPQNSLYCGITTSVERRFKQHCSGTGAKALRGKSPLELVWSYQVGSNKGDALRLECIIKRLPKAKKEQLVINPSYIDLYL